MNELDFVMEDGAGDQRMQIGSRQPLEKIAHQMLHPFRRRCHVNELTATINPDSTRAKHPGVIHQCLHHHSMSGEKVLHRFRLPSRQQVVARDGILHFLDFPHRADHPLAFENRRHFVNPEAVIFNCQRCLNRLNPVCLPQLRGKRQIPPTPAPDPLADLPDQRELTRRDREGWVVGSGHREIF